MYILAKIVMAQLQQIHAIDLHKQKTSLICAWTKALGVKARQCSRAKGHTNDPHATSMMLSQEQMKNFCPHIFCVV